ncbi:nose resistant to fluoxetine protein 6-like [Anthonomus grandis grandis]|uniref:nose resistant to fluoxetine protein 6-like n=1 Tax=Anthonomus grandis grandis TaxID=2921223 RepID=UPI0021669A2D|nr:nose resistant to fluoxetine protein 6-like [Anthonomus grandis grandis]
MFDFLIFFFVLFAVGPNVFSANLNKTFHEVPSETKVFFGLFDQFKWFKFLPVVSDNEKCKSDLEVYLGSLENGTSWAAKMYDATGRYNGEFYFGNNYWTGSWTSCHELQTKEPHKKTPPFPTYFYVAKVTVFGQSKITSTDRQIHLGLCLPLSCGTKDIKNLLFKEIEGAKVRLEVTDVRAVPGNYSLIKDVKFQILGAFAISLASLILIASLVDLYIRKKRNCIYPENRNENNNIASTSKESGEGVKRSKSILNVFLEILLAFSSIKNARKIISSNTSSTNICCLDGLRVFSIAWIILVHTFLQAFGIGRNKDLRIITERTFLYQTISNATFSVDTFFFISGFLVSLGVFRNSLKPDKKHEKKWTSLLTFGFTIFYRVLRLTPAYLFLIGVSQVAMSYISTHSVFTSGFIDHITCEKFWWRNILYINNLYPQKEMCMLWSWYMANDTQFFVLGTVLLLIAIRGPKHLNYIGIVTLIIFLSSWIVTFMLAMTYNYTAKIQAPFFMFDLFYDKPWMRITPYLVGMITGYVHFKLKGKLLLTPAVVTIGWILSLACLASLVYGLGEEGLVLPASALYVSLGHTAWAISLSWITIACSFGYGGPINTLLSCKLFLPLSRLTYCAYLVHPILMYLTSLILDEPLPLHAVLIIVVFLGNFLSSFIVAFVLSLALESPVINLIKMVLSW